MHMRPRKGLCYSAPVPAPLLAYEVNNENHRCLQHNQNISLGRSFLARCGGREIHVLNSRSLCNSDHAQQRLSLNSVAQ